MAADAAAGNGIFADDKKKMEEYHAGETTTLDEHAKAVASGEEEGILAAAEAKMAEDQQNAA